MNANNHETALSLDLGLTQCRCKELEHQHKNDEAANRMLTDALEALKEENAALKNRLSKYEAHFSCELEELEKEAA